MTFLFPSVVSLGLFFFFFSSSVPSRLLLLLLFLLNPIGKYYEIKPMKPVSRIVATEAREGSR